MAEIECSSCHQLIQDTDTECVACRIFSHEHQLIRDRDTECVYCKEFSRWARQRDEINDRDRTSEIAARASINLPPDNSSTTESSEIIMCTYCKGKSIMRVANRYKHIIWNCTDCRKEFDKPPISKVAIVPDNSFDGFLERTQNMSTKEKGDQFEMACQELLENMGWKVERQGGPGDRGVDLILTKSDPTGDTKIVVQCKYSHGNIAADVVLQTLGTMRPNKAQRALVITSGRFSQEARSQALAEADAITLWDYDQVRKWWAEYIT